MRNYVKHSELIADIAKNRKLYGTCPHCGEDFRLGSARLFSAKETFPTEALSKIQELKAGLKQRRTDLKALKERMTNRSRITAQSVNLGKIVEKIAPSFGGFHFVTRDCRSLLEPIDYVIFSGLHRTGSVESITFLDVKSGGSRLNPMQRNISNIVGQNKIEVGTIESKIDAVAPEPEKLR
jgi:predicted Holliday junction resolvase-like endonuclease